MIREENSVQNSFTVPFVYPVLFEEDIFERRPNVLTDRIDRSGNARTAVFVDSGLHAVASQLLSAIEAALAHRLATPVQIVAGGETGKFGLAHVERCAAVMNDAKIDRHAYVLAIGGGAMLDVVGFAAAIVHRGVRLIRMPTTVLAQNDAGIGVKNGVNGFGKKNFLGTFAPPHAVINDFSLLRTLQPEQWRDGTAEAVKVALIRDGSFFQWIEQNASLLVERDADAFRYLIRRCAELHLQHITTSGDPFERGSARPLDFGHWSAHKLESLSHFQISHGHAVAIGMAIDATYATKMKLCEPDVTRRIVNCLRSLQFPFGVGPSLAIDVDSLLGGIAEFQEHLGGRLSLAMVPAIGRVVEIHSVDLAVLRECVHDILFS